MATALFPTFIFFKASMQGLGFFFRIGGPYSEQVRINGIPEEAIVYNYKEVGINNLAELRCAEVQLGQNIEQDI